MSALKKIKRINLSYNIDDSENSAKRIYHELYPEQNADDLKIKAFSEGITNTMLKITPASNKDNPIVLRAFGPGAEPLVSRPREIATHAMFSEYGLAPSLLARFKNGFLYTFTSGKPCDADLLTDERVWRGVAKTMGRWHAVLPVGTAGTVLDGEDSQVRPDDAKGSEAAKQTAEEKAPGDIWAVMRTWASRIPTNTDEGAKVKKQMKEEVEYAFQALGSREGLDGQRLVMGHCDLLAGNVLFQEPEDEAEKERAEAFDVTLIDYEYSVACPAAFDIATHIGEWAGFECNYERIPGPKVRETFLEEYVRSWRQNRKSPPESAEDEDVAKMVRLVDEFRGLDGLWFGLWGLVQAEDSSEEFDYREYAKLKLGEYWAWKGESGHEVGKGKSDPALRERKWWGKE